MSKTERQEELQRALDLLDSASHEEKRELFAHSIGHLEAYRIKFENPENRFDSYKNNAIAAAEYMARFYRDMTGYNAGWAVDTLIEHGSSKTGRPTKYDTDTRAINCHFIAHLLKRGASETQAMKLIARLRGDAAESSGQMLELRQTFQDFKNTTDYEYVRERPLLDDMTYIVYILDFDTTHLIGSDKASAKAVDAFRSIAREMIEFMQAAHDLIAAKDRSYPNLFGPVIGWLAEDHDDPIDYFCRFSNFEAHERSHLRFQLLQYINAAKYFSGDQSLKL